MTLMWEGPYSLYSHIQECLGIKWTWSWQEGWPAVWWSQCVVALRKTMTSFWCTSTTELWKRNYRHHAHWLNWTNPTPSTLTYVFHWTNNYPPFLPTFISPYQPSDLGSTIMLTTSHPNQGPRTVLWRTTLPGAFWALPSLSMCNSTTWSLRY